MKTLATLCLFTCGAATVSAAAELRPHVAASGRCGSARATSAVPFSTGLAIVPFAVPVAVPVAVVSQPAVLYAYRADVIGQWSVVSGQSEGAAGGLDHDVEEQPLVDRQRVAPDRAIAVLRQRCAACHAGSSAKGDLPIFGDDGAIVERLPRQVMLEAVESGKMPKGAAPLNADELELLREWAKPRRELVY